MTDKQTDRQTNKQLYKRTLLKITLAALVVVIKLKLTCQNYSLLTETLNQD